MHQSAKYVGIYVSVFLIGPGAIAVLCTVLEKACPYFRPPAGPAMSKPALTALQWSTLVARHSQDVNDVIVKSQVRYAAYIVGELIFTDCQFFLCTQF